MVTSVTNYGSSCKLINICLFKNVLLILIALSSSSCETKNSGDDNDDSES
jgi:hypothetical protein